MALGQGGGPTTFVCSTLVSTASSLAPNLTRWAGLVASMEAGQEAGL